MTTNTIYGKKYNLIEGCKDLFYSNPLDHNRNINVNGRERNKSQLLTGMLHNGVLYVLNEDATSDYIKVELHDIENGPTHTVGHSIWQWPKSENITQLTKVEVDKMLAVRHHKKAEQHSNLQYELVDFHNRIMDSIKDGNKLLSKTINMLPDTRERWIAQIDFKHKEYADLQLEHFIERRSVVVHLLEALSIYLEGEWLDDKEKNAVVMENYVHPLEQHIDRESKVELLNIESMSEKEILQHYRKYFRIYTNKWIHTYIPRNDFLDVTNFRLALKGNSRYGQLAHHHWTHDSLEAMREEFEKRIKAEQEAENDNG